MNVESFWEAKALNEYFYIYVTDYHKQVFSLAQTELLDGRIVRSRLRFLVKCNAMNMTEGSAVQPLHNPRGLPKHSTHGIEGS